jgi:hypothetical protein
MQLVLSNNRIIAHGENFLAMGGVVINAETGAKFENATVAECDGCPSDIDKVGYEYHAGVFVPCAPYGVGNGKGYVMEVCTDCATPRNSGIPMSVLKWESLSEIVFVGTSEQSALNKQFALEFPASAISEYPDLRVVIKDGYYETDNTHDTTITIGGSPIWFEDVIPPSTKRVYENVVIRRIRQEIFKVNYAGALYIAVSNYYPVTHAMTFELQGRKE